MCKHWQPKQSGVSQSEMSLLAVTNFRPPRTTSVNVSGFCVIMLLSSLRGASPISSRSSDEIIPPLLHIALSRSTFAIFIVLKALSAPTPPMSIHVLCSCSYHLFAVSLVWFPECGGDTGLTRLETLDDKLLSFASKEELEGSERVHCS